MRRHFTCKILSLLSLDLSRILCILINDYDYYNIKKKWIAAKRERGTTRIRRVAIATFNRALGVNVIRGERRERIRVCVCVRYAI